MGKCQIYGNRLSGDNFHRAHHEVLERSLFVLCLSLKSFYDLRIGLVSRVSFYGDRFLSYNRDFDLIFRIQNFH